MNLYVWLPTQTLQINMYNINYYIDHGYCFHINQKTEYGRSYEKL